MDNTRLKALYAQEKLSTAVRLMATSPKDLRGRIILAFNEFNTLILNGVPDGEISEKWDDLYARLTAREEPMEHRLGSVQYTLDEISDDDVQKIAEDIVELKYMVDVHLEYGQ
jgi:hypothetical protein